MRARIGTWIALAAGILVSGCTHRMVVSIESHPKAPLMHLGIHRYVGDNVNAVVEHEFWTTSDSSGLRTRVPIRSRYATSFEFFSSSRGGDWRSFMIPPYCG